jgi:hypothetical protein
MEKLKQTWIFKAIFCRVPDPPPPEPDPDPDPNPKPKP